MIILSIGIAASIFSTCMLVWFIWAFVVSVREDKNGNDTDGIN